MVTSLSFVPLSKYQNSMYKIVRFFLFKFDPEKVHYFTANLLNNILKVPGMKWLWRKTYSIEDVRLEKKLFGLTFKSPVGLAAGFDKNATMIDDLSHCGFGFIEIGTVTPKAQEGNPKPRLFRLQEDQAIINRMGFNNKGVDYIVENLKRKKTKIIVGGNIGKNTNSTDSEYIDDYKTNFSKLHPYVDYFVVNVSCPNVGSMATLQDKDFQIELLEELKAINENQSIQRPILLKIAPDLNKVQLDEVIEIVLTTKIDGIIASNTSTSRENLISSKDSLEKIGMGGVSGQPVKDRSTEVIRYLAEKSNKAFPIIGVGGIHSAEDALEKIDAGADLVQIFTGFIYEGPGLIKKINKALLARK